MSFLNSEAKHRLQTNNLVQLTAYIDWHSLFSSMHSEPS